MRKNITLAAAVSAILVSAPLALLQPAMAQSYTAIGARKPANAQAKKLVFVACRADGTLGKYRGARKDLGSAKFLASLTAAQAKKLIKPLKKPAAKRSDFPLLPVLVKGKVPYSTKKNLATLNAEIDACEVVPTPTPGPTQSAVATGVWEDSLRSTSGAISLAVTVDREERSLSMQVGVSGSPLGIVDAADIPPETYVVSVPEGRNVAEFSFGSSFLPGAISGAVTINEQTGTFSATGSATHNQLAGGFANTSASFNASGPLVGANVGAITISGSFPAGGNQFSISTAPTTGGVAPHE